MAEWYSCFHCKSILHLPRAQEARCPICGATDGEVVSQKRIEKAFESYYNDKPDQTRRWKPRTYRRFPGGREAQ